MARIDAISRLRSLGFSFGDFVEETTPSYATYPEDKESMAFELV